MTRWADIPGTGRLTARQARLIGLLALPGVLALAAWLRFDGLAAQSLWGDEALTWYEARGSFVDVLERTVDAISSPPLHNILVYFGIEWFGDSETVLRAPSAVSGVLSVAALYCVGTMFGGRGVGLLAALLLALSQFHIWFSQEARPYALFTLVATLFVGTALRMFETRRAGWAVAAAVLGCLVLYTHPYGLFMWLSVAGVLVVQGWRRRFTQSDRVWIIALAASIAGFLPWMLVLIGRYRSIATDGFWISEPTAGYVFGQLRDLTSGGAMGLALTVAALAAMVPTHWLRTTSDEGSEWNTRRFMLLAWLCGPFALALAASLVGQPILHGRYLIASLPALLLLAALGCRNIAASRSALFLLFGAAIVCVAVLWQEKPSPKVDWRGAVASYRSQSDPSDCVVLYQGWSARAFTYYDRRRHTCLQRVDRLDAIDWSAIDTPRLWVFLYSPIEPPERTLEALHDHNWSRAQRAFNRISVIHAERR